MDKQVKIGNGRKEMLLLELVHKIVQMTDEEREEFIFCCGDLE